MHFTTFRPYDRNSSGCKIQTPNCLWKPDEVLFIRDRGRTSKKERYGNPQTQWVKEELAQKRINKKKSKKIFDSLRNNEKPNRIGLRKAKKDFKKIQIRDDMLTGINVQNYNKDKEREVQSQNQNNLWGRKRKTGLQRMRQHRTKRTSESRVKPKNTKKIIDLFFHLWIDS